MSSPIIRPYLATDAPAVMEAALESVAEIEPWMPWCHAGYNLELAREWIALSTRNRADGTSYEFMICDDEDRCLGACGINDFHREYPIANIGYWVRSSASGRGVAPAAVRLAVRWAFANTPLQRLEIVAATGNVRSQRVAEKAGAIREGVLRARLQLHGRLHDAVMYSIVRSDVSPETG